MLSKREVLLVSAAVCLTCAGGTSSRQSEDIELLQSIARTVTVYRDDFGVAHVYGPTDAAAAFGFAYAQAEDNFIRAIGRAAAVHGEEVLLDDWINRGLAAGQERGKSSSELHDFRVSSTAIKIGAKVVRTVRHLPDGRGGCATRAVQGDPGED